MLGREREIEELDRSLKSEESELLAVYGRRRVGKTYMIRKHYASHIVFDITGIRDGEQELQLQHFYEQLLLVAPRFKGEEVPQDWFAAFQMLSTYINGMRSKKKKVIFIDEFPWFCSQRSPFLKIFEHFWNNYCTKRNDLVVVVCGSAAAFMVNKVIRNRGGLHGRISKTLRLMPFTLYESKLYLQSKGIDWLDYDILQLYMAFGGIPYYMSFLNEKLTVTQNIDRLCFAEGGLMIKEFEEALMSLFTNSAIHRHVIETLAARRKGYTRKQIVALTRRPDNGDFSNALKELQESGFVTRYQAYDGAKRKALYRLSDEYSFFYLNYVEKYEGQGEGTWHKLAAMPTYKAWSGFAFESVCLKHIAEIKKGLGVQIMHTVHSSWHNEEAQIDLVIDRADNRIDIFELKFYQGPFEITKSYFEKLQQKQWAFKESVNRKRKNILLSMLTTYGVKDNKYRKAIVHENMTMEVLFQKAY